MATVNKDFKIKNGLIVEGSTATVNGNPVLTETASDQYIIDLIGGETLITSVDPTDFKVSVGGELQIDSLSTLARTSDIPTSTDDLSEGATNKYYVKGTAESDIGAFLANASKTNINITYDPVSGLEITAENGVADSTTDNLTEGTSNLYFTDQRVTDVINNIAGTGLDYAAGQLDIQFSTGLTVASNQLQVDRSTVDTWYDAAGTAANAIADHASDTSTHGVTGAIVGTTDTQSLSNKSFLGTTNLYDSTETYIGAIGDNGSADLVVGAENDLLLSSSVGDIVINASGSAYYGSASAANELATHGYVDNAVSGLDWKNAVNLLVTSNVDLNNAAGTYDGHSVGEAQAGYRLLLTGQSTDSQNGIYVANWDGIAVTLTRPADADAYTELIGAAVYVMEGTTYGSTSWVQADHYITDFSGQDWTQFSGQGSVTAGTGITVDGLEVSVDRTTVDTWYEPAGAIDALTTKDVAEDQDYLYFTGQRAVDAALGSSGGSTLSTYLTNLNSGGTAYIDVNTTALDALYDEAGSADAAQTNAQNYADGLASNYDAAGSADTAQTNAVTIANSYTDAEIDALTTKDVAEDQDYLYFTDQRAKDAATVLLTQEATLNNITITSDLMNGLVITAENGVADSTTDDLEEGSTNLYFTDSRAVSALEAVTPNFQSVDITWVRREEATYTNATTAGTHTAHTFSSAKGSVKYLVRVFNNGHSQVSEVLVTTDSSNNIAVTEYATIYTSENALATITADWVGIPGEYRLRVTTANNNSEILVAATVMAYND